MDNIDPLYLRGINTAVRKLNQYGRTIRFISPQKVIATGDEFDPTVTHDTITETEYKDRKALQMPPEDFQKTDMRERSNPISKDNVTYFIAGPGFPGSIGTDGWEPSEDMRIEDDGLGLEVISIDPIKPGPVVIGYFIGARV